MPAFGKTGPLRDMTSFGPGIDAMSGLSHLTGYPGQHAAQTRQLLLRLQRRRSSRPGDHGGHLPQRRTGKGQVIEVAMRDGETQLVGEYILDYVLNGRVQERAANQHPTMAPHNVYRCRGDDSWLAIAVGTDTEWAALCRVMGRPDLVTEPGFATTLDRKRNETTIDAVVAAWAEGQSRHDGMHTLQAAGVPASAVMTTEDIANDPQFSHRRAFQEVPLGEGDTIRLQRAAWTAKRAEIEIGRGPEYSEHTVQILKRLLDMTNDDIEGLIRAGAIVLPERSRGKGMTNAQRKPWEIRMPWKSWADFEGTPLWTPAAAKLSGKLRHLRVGG